MSPPPGYVTFSYGNAWPDIEGNSVGPVSYPPQGTLLNFGNLYQSADPTQGPIDQSLQAAVFLKRALFGTGAPGAPSGPILPKSSTNYTRVADGAAMWVGSTWGLNTFATWQNNTNSATDNLWFEIHNGTLPNGATLSSVSVNVTGSSSDANLPANMPTLSIWQVDATGAKTQLGGTTTDGSASAAAYKAQHTLAVTSIATVVNRSQYTYWVQVTPEYGVNSNSGMLVCSPFVTWTGSGNATY